MKNNITLIISGGALILLLFFAFTFQQKQQDTKIDTLTFSNTMQWDPALLELAHEQTYYVDDWQKYITLPDAPTNTSSTTKADLATLEADKALRTDAKVQEIIDQADINTLVFNGHPVTDYFDKTKYPLTALALEKSWHDLTAIIMSVKLKYNRVRPSFLDPALSPVLSIPGHPAYPSGHSTQSHFLAYFFAQLEPWNKDELLKEADNISQNREIAGLHYPSDTKAGELLAQQFMAILLQNKEFQTLLNNAKKEWPQPAQNK